MNPELTNSQLRLEKKSNIENKLVGKEIPEPQNSQILLEKKSNIENKLVEKVDPEHPKYQLLNYYVINVSD